MMRTDLEHCLVEIGLPQGPGVVVFRRAHHPAVAPTARAAQEAVITDAERLAGCRELLDPVLTQPVLRLLERWPRSSSTTSPSSPRVQVTSVTSALRDAYIAIVAPVPMLSSSGCAWTSTIRRDRSSGVRSIVSSRASTSAATSASAASEADSETDSPGSGAVASGSSVTSPSLDVSRTSPADRATGPAPTR